MKAIIFLCCLFLSAAFVFAQKNTKPTQTNEIENEIRRLEELGRVKSLRGDADWDGLWAEGAYLIDALGGVIVYQKGQNLSAGSPPPKVLKMSDVIVRVYGETAVVTALMEIEIETAEKKTVAFSLRFMNVWKKFDDGWKIVAAERTPVRQMPK
jgi:hypothetical protein